MNKKIEQSEIIKNQAKNIERKVRWGNVDDILDENLSPSSYCLVHNYIIDLHKEIEDLQKKAEQGEHYKHLYNEVKKQKDDGIDWIKNNFCYVGKKMSLKPYSDLKDLLRMLGDSDDK